MSGQILQSYKEFSVYFTVNKIRGVREPRDKKYERITENGRLLKYKIEKNVRHTGTGLIN